jgi:hypothetical protein
MAVMGDGGDGRHSHGIHDGHDQAGAVINQFNRPAEVNLMPGGYYIPCQCFLLENLFPKSQKSRIQYTTGKIFTMEARLRQIPEKGRCPLGLELIPVQRLRREDSRDEGKFALLTFLLLEILKTLENLDLSISLSTNTA